MPCLHCHCSHHPSLSLNPLLLLLNMWLLTVDSIPNLSPSVLSTAAVGELGVLVIVSGLEGPAAGAKPTETPLPDVLLGHN